MLEKKYDDLFDDDPRNIELSIDDDSWNREELKKKTQYSTDSEKLEANQDVRSHRAKEKQGCYVATCIYGSYDCPEVWTLRRYRDYGLKKTWYGRLFIKFYYAVSPLLVKIFGGSEKMREMFKSELDLKVLKLREQGYDHTEYFDE